MTKNKYLLTLLFAILLCSSYLYFHYWIPFYYVLLAVSILMGLLGLSDYSQSALLKKILFLGCFLNILFFAYKLTVSHEKLVKKSKKEVLLNLGVIQKRSLDEVKVIEIHSVVQSLKLEKIKDNWWVRDKTVKDWASSSEILSLWNLFTQSPVEAIYLDKSKARELSFDQPNYTIEIIYEDLNRDTFELSYFRDEQRNYFMKYNNEYLKVSKIWEVILAKKYDHFRSYKVIPSDMVVSEIDIEWGAHKYIINLGASETYQKAKLYSDSLRILSADLIIDEPKTELKIFINLKINKEFEITIYQLGERYILYHNNRKIWMQMSSEVQNMRWTKENFKGLGVKR